jgi:hypothetical protein
MLCFDYDHYADRIQLIKKRFRDLLRQAFLHLKPPRKDLGDPREF